MYNIPFVAVIHYIIKFCPICIIPFVTVIHYIIKIYVSVNSIISVLQYYFTIIIKHCLAFVDWFKALQKFKYSK